MVKVRNLVKRFGDILAVDNVSFEIAEGEVFGLLGPNGAGKTTTINILTGLIKMDSGNLQVLGRDFKKDEMEIKGKMGIVPQELAVFDDLTAQENLDYFGRLYGLRGSRLKEGVENALEFSGLYERRRDYPKKFSGGMKRRLNIACALVHSPKLLIMDEPTVGIDPQSRNHILQSIKLLNKHGSTVIYTSHYMEEVEEICSRILIMDHGRVLAEGTKEELRNLSSIEEKAVFRLLGVNYTLLEAVKGLKEVANAELEGPLLTVEVHKNAATITNIVNQITKAGAEIVSVNMEKPNLESAFLTLTGRKLRD